MNTSRRIRTNKIKAKSSSLHSNRGKRHNKNVIAKFTIITISILLTIISFSIKDKQTTYYYEDTINYTVQKNDTLWLIAKLYSDNRYDTRKVIYEIQQLSNCDANLQIGEQLIIPLYELMKEK